MGDTSDGGSGQAHNMADTSDGGFGQTHNMGDTSYGGCFMKFWLLLWKNYILQTRHKVQTLFEILLPLIFCFILVYLRIAVKAKKHDNNSYYPEFDPRNPESTHAMQSIYILYTPDSPEVQRIIVTMQNISSEISNVSVAQAVENLKKNDTNTTTTALPFPIPPSLNLSEFIRNPDILFNSSRNRYINGFLGYKFIGFKDERSMLKDYHDNPAYSPMKRESAYQLPGMNNLVKPVLAAIVFHTNPEESNEIKYVLRFPAVHHGAHPKEVPPPRWFTHLTYPPFQFPGPRNQASNETSENINVSIALHVNRRRRERGGDPGYWQQGFLFLQSAVDTAIIHTRAKNSSKLAEFEWGLGRFPYPTYIEDEFIFALQAQLPMFVVLSFIYSSINIAKSIAHEKERRLKELMKMMGLPNWLHWSAWFTKSIIFLLVSIILMTIIYKIRFGEQQLSVLTYADGSLFFCFLLAYAFSLIMYCFLIAAFFSTANSASTASGVIFFVMFFPYMFLQPRYSDLSKGLKMGMCIFSNTAFGFGCNIIVLFEGIATGIQWSTIGEGVSPDDTLSMLDIIMMLVLDGFLYLLLAIYVEGIFPGDYGVPLPWYFPFTKWYWTGEIRGDSGESNKVHPEGSSTNNNDTKDSESFEKEPAVNAGIRIIDLKKIFGPKAAVNGLNLNFYENQVTALLGHNGAGKTTTMSMITGLFPPTSGTVIVNGFDVRTDILSVRKSLGLCPQHDVLFDEMTVEEHLWFFCMLKGYNRHLVQDEVNRMVEALYLENKRHSESHTLSGGMKRKLSVGIALVGGSKVVLLDEPTSGMDPGARRSTWDLISSEKKGRTVVLSTHFMDEADLLGDRIAIMAHGKVICCGSSLFLKRKYGGGYHVIMVKTPNCKVELITKLIQEHIPEVNIDQNIGTELSYSLPEGKVKLFPVVFEELEKRKTELGIASYGCSITQMEEVFMRVGEKVDEERSRNNSQEVKGDQGESQSQQVSVQKLESKSNQVVPPSSTGIPSEDTSSVKDRSVAKVHAVDSKSSHLSSTPTTKLEINTNYIYGRTEGYRLLFQQFQAMLVKKCLYARRNLFIFLIQGFVPIFFFIIVMILLKTYPGLGGSPASRNLDLKKFSSVSKPLTAMECPSTHEDICQSFRQVAESETEVITTGKKSFEEYILDEAAKDLPRVNVKYMVGLRANSSGPGPGNSTIANKTKLTGFFNNQPWHIPPVALNFVSNTILRFLAEKDELKLTVSNHPLPYTSHDSVDSVTQSIAQGFHIGMNLTFGMSFLAASFVVFLVKERESKSKHLQYVSGVKFPIFWLANFLFDVMYYVIPCLILVVILVAFRMDQFQSVGAVMLFFLVLMMYGWAVIPLMYLCSFFFTIPSSGYTRMTFFNLVSGTATVLAVTILSLPEFHLEHVASKLAWVFSIFPNFHLGYSMQHIAYNFNLLANCPYVLSLCPFQPEFDCCTDKYPTNYLAWNSPGIGKSMFFLFITGLFCQVLLFLIESKIVEEIWFRNYGKKYVQLAPAQEDPNSLEDSDVAAENERIRYANMAELFMKENMVLRDLTKYYGSFLAVDRLCLGVQAGECFGLLGVNGAGKTTTFKMLTGDFPISLGEAYVIGKSVKSEIKDVQRVIGYCPQFDALIPELTGRETIRLFARLRGIQEFEIDELVDRLAADLLFSEYIEKPCGTYSGGNKRKLSTALALIGNPPIVFLDEPTTGMDPVARRHLWNTIIKVREGGTSVILTSHSMEECEALCTRLAIMVNGKFRCLGSTQHLKNKFGDGYTLVAQMEAVVGEPLRRTRTSLETGRRRESIGKAEPWELNLQPLRNFIESNFQDCILKDMHPCYVDYHIPAEGAISWAEMFEKMEQAKVLFRLEAYSVGQTSLEQVFLGFAKGQCNDD